MEYQMNYNITSHELLADDRVVPDYLSVPVQNRFNGFSRKIDREKTSYSDGQPSMGYHSLAPVSDMEADFDQFRKSSYRVDRGMAEAKKIKAEWEEAVGDILPVRVQFPSFAYNMANTICEMMGMEVMMTSMYDYPDLFRRAMDMLTRDYLAYMDEIEEAGAILTNNDGSLLYQGSWGYTNALPGPEDVQGKVTFKDVWGFTEMQECADIAPDMVYEFFFAYLERVANRLGLLSFGCCEPVDRYWDKCLSRLDNLRKLSVSPWCDEKWIADCIRGKKIVFHRKPMPNYISVDQVFDEDAFRKHIGFTAEAARGCPLEVTFRDVITARGEPHRLTKAVAITKEEFVRRWRP